MPHHDPRCTLPPERRDDPATLTALLGVQLDCPKRDAPNPAGLLRALLDVARRVQGRAVVELERDPTERQG